MRLIRANMPLSFVLDITIDSSSSNTYTKQYTSGGITATYKINGTTTTLPFSVSVGDVLKITSSDVGRVELY